MTGWPVVRSYRRMRGGGLSAVVECPGGRVHRVHGNDLGAVLDDARRVAVGAAWPGHHLAGDPR